jgi:hypothetical protein
MLFRVLSCAVVVGCSFGSLGADAPNAKDAKRDVAPIAIDQGKQKPHHQLLREAKEQALKNFKAGVEKSFAKFPTISAESKAMLRSSSVHQSWIANTIDECRKQTTRLPKEDREKAELAALAIWTEARVEEFMDTTLTYKLEEDKIRKKAAAELAKKRKKGGENTAAPNGLIIQGGGAGASFGP